MADAGQCKGVNRDGKPCGAAAHGGDWCPWHDPSRAADRAQWRVEGGKAKANARRARKKVFAAGLELSEVDGALCAALARVLTGRMEPGVGTAAATIARAIVTIRQAGEVEERLAQLEAAAGITEGGRAS